MSSLFLFLSILFILISFNQTVGTRPSDNFECHSLDKPKRINVIIETGSGLFAGTNDKIWLFLRDSQGYLCTADDLNNPGDDHEAGSTDHYAICCSQDFAKANEYLSVLLLGHNRYGKGHGNDWFIDRIEVRAQNVLLFEFRFHAWTKPHKVAMIGASKVISSGSNNKKPSYSLIHL